VDFELAEEERRFVAEVEAFLAERFSPDVMDESPEQLSQTVDTPAKRAFMRELAARGWLGMSWPKQYGGQERPGLYDFLLTEALSRWGAPQPGKGVGIVGKTLIRHGNEKLKRFFLPDASAVLRRDPARPEVLLVEAAYGIGDLLAAGLVVPDRYAIRAADGGVLEKKIGRKTQMSVPRKDGGVRRVPVPPALARTDALDDGSTAPLADLWRAAETAVGPLASLSVALSGREQRVTAAALAQVQGPQPG